MLTNPLKISTIDASNYLKGLMLLIRKDHKITGTEIVLLKRIGKSLGFEPEFCEKTINEILYNRFIEDNPPVFEKKELAIKFIKDGLAVIFSDNIMHQVEENWLIATAEKNDIDVSLYYEFKKNYSSKDEQLSRLEVDDLTVGY